MSISVLIAGKEFEDNSIYISSASSSGRNIIVASENKNNEINEEESNTIIENKKIIKFPWNRSSAISTRAMIFESENTFKKIDEALIFFDTDEYAKKFTTFDTASFTKAVDHMILGYGYLCSELIQRFSRQKSGILIFILKSTQAFPNLSIPVLAAKQFFTALAESIANAVQTESSYKVVLIRSENSSDGELCNWLYPFIESLPSKTVSRWYKVGAKTNSVFSFFR